MGCCCSKRNRWVGNDRECFKCCSYCCLEVCGFLSLHLLLHVFGKTLLVLIYFIAHAHVRDEEHLRDEVARVRLEICTQHSHTLHPVQFISVIITSPSVLKICQQDSLELQPRHRRVPILFCKLHSFHCIAFEVAVGCTEQLRIGHTMEVAVLLTHPDPIFEFLNCSSIIVDWFDYLRKSTGRSGMQVAKDRSQLSNLCSLSLVQGFQLFEFSGETFHPGRANLVVTRLLLLRVA
mmetsp:Transcript_39469/g.77668  ORF Transcript_39469/g.77668 Transcript_39469/m.77668 type:complete len:235 (-) Transcript_39469:54-758(-)